MKCWHCDAVVTILANGWFCPQCGQTGDVGIARSIKEGTRLNQPYKGKPYEK